MGFTSFNLPQGESELSFLKFFCLMLEDFEAGDFVGEQKPTLTLPSYGSSISGRE